MTKPLAFKNAQQKISVKIKLLSLAAPLKQNLKTLYHPNKSTKNAKMLKFSPNDKKKKKRFYATIISNTLICS
ncbi:hypothetical protein BTM237_01890 [Helicobacter pylori]